MWLRTAARWDVGRINGPVQAHYRVHEANMHLTTYQGWVTDLVERRRTFQILFDERAVDVPEVQGLRPVAARALAREARRRARVALYDGDAVEAEAYLAFAAETYPAERIHVSRLLPPAKRVVLGVERVSHHLRWRRERRYGT
jgi:hypothetical protein